MGRHTNFGHLVAHDVMNGIDHANIDPELTVENWESKAIIRGGNYVWVLKGLCAIERLQHKHCFVRTRSMCTTKLRPVRTKPTW